MADSAQDSPQRGGKRSALETRVLVEKATGLSNLEVAAKLMLAEWAVRSIVRKHGGNSSTAFRPRHEARTSVCEVVLGGAFVTVATDESGGGVIE